MSDAYILEIPGGTICQRCRVACTIVAACHHNVRLCQPCAFYEPCDTCVLERFEDGRIDIDIDDDWDGLKASTTPRKPRYIDIKDPRLT